MRHPLIAAAALGLAACQPRGNDHADDPPEPPAFAGEFDARGANPIWSLHVGTDALVLEQDGKPTISAPNPGRLGDDGEAVWSTTAGGEPFIVTLADRGECSDGTSNIVYPYVAVVMLGEATLRGCAAKRSSPAAAK